MLVLESIEPILGQMFDFLWHANIRVTLVFGLAAIVVGFWPKSTAAIRHRAWALAFCFAGLVPILTIALPQFPIPLLKSPTTVAEAVVDESFQFDELTQPIGPSSMVPGKTNEANKTGVMIGQVPSIRTTEGPTGPEFSTFQTSLQTKPANKPTTISGFELSSLFVPLWLVISIAFLVHVVVRHWKAFRLAQSAQPIGNDSSVALFNRLRSAMGIKTDVKFLESSKTIAPLALGLVRPAVILPRGWEAWPDQQKRQVLIHELSHVKRADVVFQTIASSITALFWFNPIAWYALKRLRSERELAADNCVVQAGEKPSGYAKTLISLIQSYQRRSLVAGASVTGSGEFKRRLAAILDPACRRDPVDRDSSRTIFLTFAFFSIAIATFSLVARNALAEDSSDRKIKLSGTVTDELGNPLEQVGVFILEDETTKLNDRVEAKEIARTNAHGQFEEEIRLKVSQANRIAFFKAGWSISFDKTQGEAQQRFTKRLVKDQPIELNMQFGSDKRLERESINIQLLSHNRSATKQELGNFRNSGSLVGFEGDIVESIEQIPGVVNFDKSGKLILHGLGTQKLLQFRTKPKNDSTRSLVLFASEIEAKKDLARVGPSYRTAAISFHHGPPKTSLKPELAEFINEKLIEYPFQTEFSFALIKNGEVSFYGVMNDGGKARITDNSKSVFEIGSITKVFTSNLLAQLVLDDKVKLNQTVQSLTESDFADQKITLRQLASHSSGLPQMPQSFFESGYDEANPYAKFSTSSLFDALANGSLVNPEKVGSFQYSNFGVSILGQAISSIEGKDFEGIFQERIGKPLGMNSTTTVRSQISDRIVKGLDSEGRTCSYWDCNAITPAGGLYSNAHDLAKYAMHCLSGNSKPYMLQREPVLTRSKSVDQGLGWMLLNSKSGKSFSFHAGGTGGFSAFMAIEPQSRDGLIMLTNVEGGNDSTDQFAFDLLARIHRMTVIDQSRTNHK